MSTNGKPEFTFDCPVCQAPISTKLPSPDAPVNSLRLSIIAVPHEKPIRCSCGQYFVFIIEPTPLSVGVVPITEQQAAPLLDSMIIVPPAGVLSLVK